MSERCDPYVYKNGEHVASCTWPKECIEALCGRLAAKTGARVDWSYVGGIGVIQAVATVEQRRKIQAYVEEAAGRLVWVRG